MFCLVFVIVVRFKCLKKAFLMPNLSILKQTLCEIIKSIYNKLIKKFKLIIQNNLSIYRHVYWSIYYNCITFKKND